MKKILKQTFLVISIFIMIMFSCYFFRKNYEIFSYAKIIENNENVNFNKKITRNYTFRYFNKIFKFCSNDFNIELTKTQEKLILSEENFDKNILMLISFGLSKREIVEYICPEIQEIKEKLCRAIDVFPEENYVVVEKNKCKLDYIFGQQGKFLNQDDFYNKMYEFVKNNSKNINFDILVNFYNDENDIKNDFCEKSSFVTNFSSSSFSRKNNIKVALEKFDGLVLEQGEVMSFNDVTGTRNESNGYMEAKIISNGTFTSGYGGGVCQVSTTIYNACLLAGLDILEVHNHSLPVSYIEPCFDAMVNAGSSDLVIRNNTDGKIIITTSFENDYCKVKIFGKKNKYKITRFSEKVKIIPAENDIIETDIEKYGDLGLEIGEERRLSYAKDGYYSNGFLNYYDENGTLVETVKIRQNRYNPTRGIILKREN